MSIENSGQTLLAKFRRLTRGEFFCGLSSADFSAALATADLDVQFGVRDDRRTKLAWIAETLEAAWDKCAAELRRKKVESFERAGGPVDACGSACEHVTAATDAITTRFHRDYPDCTSAEIRESFRRELSATLAEIAKRAELEKPAAFVSDRAALAKAKREAFTVQKPLRDVQALFRATHAADVEADVMKAAAARDVAEAKVTKLADGMRATWGTE